MFCERELGAIYGAAWMANPGSRLGSSKLTKISLDISKFDAGEPTAEVGQALNATERRPLERKMIVAPPVAVWHGSF